MTEMEVKAKATPGRPRDPDLDDRVIDVALRVYAEHGWSGFSFGMVARQAAVGKAALYLRWPTKAEMLVAALTARPVQLTSIDTGTIREDLVELGREMLRYLNSEPGLAALRLFIDGRYQPELYASIPKEWNAAPLAVARAIVRRGIERGELPEGTSAQVVLDAIIGGAMNHLLSNPDKSWAVLQRHGIRFLAELVDMVVVGAWGPAQA
jgi:AcrR family transcriptional regulator